MTAARSGIRLTNADAGVIKGMIARGDRQHDIAAYFGVNGGRIGEISKGSTFSSVPVMTANLPPAGPYMTPIATASMRKRLTDAKAKLASALPIGSTSQTAVEDAIAELAAALKEVKLK